MSGEAANPNSTTGVQPRVVITRPIFSLSAELLTALRDLRDVRGHDEFTRKHDAFLLDPGLGPPTYLTSDGRILWDDDIWGVEGTRRDVVAAIVAGIGKTGLDALAVLLPKRPSDASACVKCHGNGRFDAEGQLRDVEGRPFSVVCMSCAGLGWTAPSLRLDESLLSAA